MKRVIALLLVFVMVVCMLASCDDTTAETHVHTYRDTLSSDAEGHWYDATCTCTDVEVKKLAHADANNDGACDVCTFTNHTHTYAEGWTADCTNHWHAADCGHTVVGVEAAAHADENDDGKCDVCAYIIEDIHVHVFDTAWTTDAEYHWHAALCEHDVEVADKAAHTIDDAGYCTVCDAKVKTIDATNIEAVLKAAVARNNKVTGGKVQYSNESYSWNEEYGYAESLFSINNLVTYTLGNGHSYINYISVFEEEAISNQQWFELIDAESGEIFGVESLDGGVTLTPTMGDPDKLNGYTYMPSELLASFDNTSTLADTLLAIYTLSNEAGAADVEVEYDADMGAFYITYTYLVVSELEGVNQETGEPETVVNTNYYEVAAAFTVDANGVVDQAMILVDAFLDQPGLDVDYTYDATAGTVTLLDTATPDRYAYMVMQTSGERTYTTAYPKASLVPSSFDLYDEMGEEIGSELNVEAGTMTYLYLGNFVPVIADASFVNADTVEMTVVNNDANDDYTFTPFFSFMGDSIFFQANKAGSFTLTISYEDIEFVITVNAVAPAPESITAHVFSMVTDYFGGENYEAAPAGVAQIASGETLDFVVKVDPSAAEQEYTYEVNSTKATISAVTLENVFYDYEMFDTLEALQFSATADGIYTITFTATADETVTGKLVVIVGDVAGLTEVAMNDFGYMGFAAYEFTAEEAGSYLFLPMAGTELMQEDSYMPGYPGYDPIPAVITLAAGESYTFYVCPGWGVSEGGFSYINLDTAPNPDAPTPWGGMDDFAAPTQGDGTRDNPYLIENAQHLAWLSRMVEDAAAASEFSGKAEVARKVFSGVYFQQTADIDLGGKEFMPIGSYMAEVSDNRHLFGGQYNGNGFKIMNAKISMADHVDKDYYKNTVATSYAPPADPSAEGAVGHYDALFNVSAGVTLQNINAVNIQTGNYDAEHTTSTAAGVICGFIIEAKIINCTTDETSSATAAHAAGMAVLTFGGGGTAIENCTNNATITGSVAADGICLHPLYDTDTQTDCTNNGQVTEG